MEDNELQILSYLQYKDFFTKSKTRKKDIAKFTMRNMLRRTLKMFTWTAGNEESKKFFDKIPVRELELQIQTRGVTGIIFYEGDYYSVWGSMGGKPNWNYMPMDYIVANPYLNISKTFNIYGEKRDVVIIPNDSLYAGLNELLSFHAGLLSEIQLTKRAILITTRAPGVFTAPDNNAKKDIDDYLRNLDEGDISAIFDKNFLKNINFIETNTKTHNVITQVLEMEQYQKAALFNDLGLQLNYNMKRETITSSEAQLGEGSLLPLCDDMLERRKEACEQLKEVFGINISVEFSSAWKDLRESIKIEMNNEKKESSQSEQIEEGPQSEQIEEGPQSEQIEEGPQSEQIEAKGEENMVIDNIEQIVNIAENILDEVKNEKE